MLLLFQSIKRSQQKGGSGVKMELLTWRWRILALHRKITCRMMGIRDQKREKRRKESKRKKLLNTTGKKHKGQ
ncbi:hypothetical protein KY285_013683 [Solanum tuberosum]|nr:hypothetical protein KY285_013683 [Solanum tuberosum]